MLQVKPLNAAVPHIPKRTLDITDILVLISHVNEVAPSRVMKSSSSGYSASGTSGLNTEATCFRKSLLAYANGMASGLLGMPSYSTNFHSIFTASPFHRLTFEVTGRRSAKRGGNLQAQLAGGPVDREVRRLSSHYQRDCHGISKGVTAASDPFFASFRLNSNRSKVATTSIASSFPKLISDHAARGILTL